MKCALEANKTHKKASSSFPPALASPPHHLDRIKRAVHPTQRTPRAAGRIVQHSLLRPPALRPVYLQRQNMRRTHRHTPAAAGAAGGVDGGEGFAGGHGDWRSRLSGNAAIVWPQPIPSASFMPLGLEGGCVIQQCGITNVGALKRASKSMTC